MTYINMHPIEVLTSYERYFLRNFFTVGHLYCVERKNLSVKVSDWKIIQENGTIKKK